jgi:hypothetical protein
MIDLQRMSNFYQNNFVKKYERGGRLKVTIHILFYGDNRRIIALRGIKFSEYGFKKNKFYFNLFLFGEAFKYGDGTKF